jgi:hypothetical protein
VDKILRNYISKITSHKTNAFLFRITPASKFRE